jgi:hypothetical protein
MATINPFYRFEDAIQVGSLGERGRIVSLALTDIYGAINVSQVGQTLSQVLATCNGLAAQYNDDLNANFVVDCFYTPDPAILYPVQIFIYDSILAVQYPLHKVSLVLIIDPTTNQVTSSSAWFMGSIPGNYNYSEPLCADELEAYKALTQYAETGSAIFPKTYKFDSQTGIASSLVARLRPCKYDAAKGTAVRFPADTYARGARPNLQFPKLSAAGAYTIKLFNSLLPLALEPTTTLYVLYLESLQWVAPDGYFITRTFDTNLPERMQINVYSSTEGFALVVRDDNDFEFQRFYAPQYSSFDFIANYAANISLPYQPADFYKYGDIFYDFDFCEFNNCAYPEKESYLMPSKSGDEYQFNVLPYQSNVLPYQSVDVGLFDKDFNLVQKIGTATKGAGITCECNAESCAEIVLTYSIPLQDWAAYLTELNQLQVQGLGTSVQFKIFEQDNLTPIYEIGQSFAPVVNLDETRIAEMLDGTDIIFEFDTIASAWKWTYTIENPECGKQYYILNQIRHSTQTPIVLWNSTLTGCPTIVNPPLQLESEVLIPSVKSDCYRFGLYRHEVNSNAGQIQLNETNFPIPDNPYNVFVIADANTYSNIVYLFVIPFGINTYQQYIGYLNRCFPESVYRLLPDEVYPSFWLCGYNATFANNKATAFGTYDFQLSQFLPQNIGSLYSGVLCSTSQDDVSEIYSFSNLISLDNSDCFSTMVQFWAESNAIAQGFEYYNDWYQQVRLGINGGGKKPVIMESTYRQSNGVTRRPQNKQDLSIDLHTDFLDLETQSALVDATRHTNFVVDGQNLFVNGDIDVATIQDFTTQSSFEDLAQVKFSALIQGYQPKNSTCVNC